MDPRVERILRKAGLDAARAVVTPLEGGITNRNYRVELEGRTLALRVSGENSALLGIDRRHEHASASIAARAGVGPEVICYLEEEGALVTRFLEGRTLSTLEQLAGRLTSNAYPVIRRSGRMQRIAAPRDDAEAHDVLRSLAADEAIELAAYNMKGRWDRTRSTP